MTRDKGGSPEEGATQTGKQSNQLDRSLEQSMDASDPPAATQPGGQDPADEAEAHPS